MEEISMSPRPNIFPALRYQDAPAAIDWLVNTFCFVKQGVFANPDGSIAHAQLQLGEAVVGLNSAYKIPGNPWCEVKKGIYVCLKDVDAHHARAVAAGADIVMPHEDKSYGSREYGARDLDGHLWGFGTYDMDAPDGQSALFPEIHYRDGAAALGFLHDAFGFRSLLVVPGVPGAIGSILHAELALGDGIFMMGSGTGDEEVWGGQSHATNVYVSDPDAHFANAKARGARIIRPPHDTPWGARGYAVRDCEGFLWGFSTYRPVATASPVERL